MVGHLSKALRLFFGIQALLFAAISLRFAWSLPRLLSLEKTNPLTGHIMGFWSPSVWLATGLALTLTLTFIFAMTTWRLARANPSARHWAIAASVLSIPIFLVGPPAQFSAGAGIVGLIIFCRRSTAAQAIVRTPKHPRLPGDGTSPLTEWIAAAAMFVGVTFAGTLWSNWAAKTGLHSSQSTLMRLLLVQFAAVLTTVIHEAGHALAAAILDMKIRHLILGPFEWRQKSGRWRFRFRPLGAFTLPGAVGAVPASLENLRWRFVLFAAAGPMASLLLGIVAAWATVSAKSMPWEPCWRLLSYIATFSLIAFVLNLVPIAQEGQYSDGARIYQLLSKTGWAGVYQAFAIVGSTLVTPLRPRNWNNQVIENAATFLGTGQKAFLLHLNCWSHSFDSGKTVEAHQAIDRAEAINLHHSLNLTTDLLLEMVFVNAISGRQAAARVWWRRAEDQLGSPREIEAGVDYWKARCALLMSEGQFGEASAAWNRGNTIATALPAAGAYEFDRFCLDRLRKMLDANAATALPAQRPVVCPC